MSLKTAALASTMSSGLLGTLPWCTTSCARRGGGLVILRRVAGVLQAVTSQLLYSRWLCRSWWWSWAVGDAFRPSGGSPSRTSRRPAACRLSCCWCPRSRWRSLAR
eukprot:7333452-Pyramimonas_sp.AAC.1